MRGMQEVIVQCRSEFSYPQEPTRFYWQGQWLEIERILNRWRSPQELGFRVMTTTQTVFELYYQESNDIWQIVLI